MTNKTCEVRVLRMLSQSLYTKLPLVQVLLELDIDLGYSGVHGMTANKRILIADDEEDIAWAISKNLAKSKYNFEIHCVDNGDNAFELISKNKYDLVISDIRMPGRNGLQLTLDVRRNFPETKIIIMTAYGSQEVMELAENRGSDFYIEKPFDMGYLRQLIFETLDMKEEGFGGFIERTGIRELVHFFCSSKSSSALSISRNGENGTIYFKDGNIVHAECGDVIGERAFYNILNWTQGTFQTNNKNIADKRTILRDWKSLLHQRF